MAKCKICGKDKGHEDLCSKCFEDKTKIGDDLIRRLKELSGLEDMPRIHREVKKD